MSLPEKIVVMTTFNTDQSYSAFARANQAVAQKLRDRMDAMLSGCHVFIQRSATVHHDAMTEPISVNMMGVMVVGDLSNPSHYYGAFAIGSKMPVLIIQQSPSVDHMMVNGVLTDKCDDLELMRAIETTFAYGLSKK